MHLEKSPVGSAGSPTLFFFLSGKFLLYQIGALVGNGRITHSNCPWDIQGNSPVYCICDNILGISLLGVKCELHHLEDLTVL